MKSRWTILADLDAWKRYMEIRKTVRAVAPEQFPCLVTLIEFPSRTSDPPYVKGFEPLYVYKQEADALAILPFDMKTYNVQHPLPEFQLSKAQCSFTQMKAGERCPKPEGHKDSHFCPCGAPFNLCRVHAPEGIR